MIIHHILGTSSSTDSSAIVVAGIFVSLVSSAASLFVTICGCVTCITTHTISSSLHLLSAAMMVFSLTWDLLWGLYISIQNYVTEQHLYRLSFIVENCQAAAIGLFAYLCSDNVCWLAGWLAGCNGLLVNLGPTKDKISSVFVEKLSWYKFGLLILAQKNWWSLYFGGFACNDGLLDNLRPMSRIIFTLILLHTTIPVSLLMFCFQFSVLFIPACVYHYYRVFFSFVV